MSHKKDRPKEFIRKKGPQWSRRDLKRIKFHVPAIKEWPNHSVYILWEEFSKNVYDCGFVKASPDTIRSFVTYLIRNKVEYVMEWYEVKPDNNIREFRLR